MPRWLYSLLLTLALPVVLLRLLWRARKAPAYARRWRERLGLPAAEILPPTRPCLWVHAVSVGEVLAALPLVRGLRREYPTLPVLVTTMTPTGSERVRVALGGDVFHCYLPYDLPGVMGRFVRRVEPVLLVVMETELWPNLIATCHTRGTPVLLANARLSERSARGYHRMGQLARLMLSQVDHIAAQAEADRQRFLSLGAAADRVSVEGSLKFDVDIPEPDGEPLPMPFAALQARQRPVWIAASTREGEEAQVLAAHRQALHRHADLLLVLVPRHPERFDVVARLCRQQGFAVCRRSEQRSPTPEESVLLGDSMGEMWRYYRLAEIAFVGGSLVPTGCQNVLEPAALGLPVLVGPSQFNFATVCAELTAAGALQTVADAEALGQALQSLLQDPLQRQYMGAAGRKVCAANRGSLERHLKCVETLLANRADNGERIRPVARG